jgi:putative sterol carrier protein
VVTVARDDRASDAADLDIDATFTQDYATAAALFRGDLTAQEAFTAGRVRVKGNMAKLVASQPALAEVGAVFDDLRQATTYEP